MMSALHWICTLTLLYCLSAQPVKRGDNDIFIQLRELNNSVQNQECIINQTLYTPTNVKSDCLYSALNCSIKELNVLEAECPQFQQKEEEQEIPPSLMNLIMLLNKKISKSKIQEHGCKACEEYEESDVLKFLENIQNLVQKLNSKD